MGRSNSLYAFVFLGDESGERASHVIRYLQPETGDIHEAFVGLQPLKTVDRTKLTDDHLDDTMFITCPQLQIPG